RPLPDHSHPSPAIAQHTAAPLPTHQYDTPQHNINTSTAAAVTMAPITSTFVPLVTLCVGSTNAFVTPTGHRASWSLANPQHAVRSSTSAVTTLHNARRRSSATPASSSLRMVSEVAEQKAAKLRETAAAFRAEAAELEEKQARERQENAQRSFNTFDSNKD
ncbi:unnamed protein product, partial [Ectocarpus sp. 13 AM-2016]